MSCFGVSLGLEVGFGVLHLITSIIGDLDLGRKVEFEFWSVKNS